MAGASQWLGGLLLVGALAATAGCGSAERLQSKGKKVYIERCSSCHQPDGGGYDEVYPNLAGNPIVRLRDPDPVIAIVLHGRGSMPSFGESLTPQEAAAVISYVRGGWGNDAPPITPA